MRLLWCKYGHLAETGKDEESQVNDLLDEKEGLGPKEDPESNPPRPYKTCWNNVIPIE